MKQDNSENGRTGIQVISRAAAVLRSLKGHPEGLSLGQIAADVDLPRSTVQRIVMALQTERLLIANMSGGGVRLGPELGALAEVARFNTAEQCKPLLVDLTQKTGETSDLSVLRGNKMIFIDQVPGTYRLRTESSVGEVFPIATTANGRACLAQMPRDEAISLAQTEALSAGVELDLGHLNQRLDEAAKTGLAYDNNEHSDGISAVGFAFKDLAGELNAISVPVPTTRFVKQKQKIEYEITKVAKLVRKTMTQLP